MGTYLNPGNSGFVRIVNSGYVDKTGLIARLNNTIGTTKNLTCISRPRRFGKSFAAQMLCAYYDRTCDSRALFDNYEIARSDSYCTHLNKYHVVYLDMTGIMGETSMNDIVSFAKRNIVEDIKEAFPQVKIEEGFAATLANLTEATQTKIVMIIDEWDAPIREAKDALDVQKQYLEFLRSLFKNSGMTSKIFAAAYMTGILPIKKDGTQSAISDFEEYTVVKPRMFGEYAGFTEDEVRMLCERNSIRLDLMRQWYDGYSFKDVGSIYNPNSVMKAIYYRDFDSYWTETSAAEALMEYISQPYHGLSKTVAELIGGIEVKVDTNGFSNDLATFRGKDDVLTLLIHLGYLAYDSVRKTARIPNEEIKLEFQKSVRSVRHSETLKRLEESDQLFQDTLNGNEEAVAAQIEKIHTEETTPLHYNREDSLRSVIKLAYYTYRDHYIQWEELPAGEGFADVVYLAKPESGWPSLVVELKWNQSAEGAIDQILKKKYPDALKGYGRDIVLVGINYDKNAPSGQRKHSCRIITIKVDGGSSAAEQEPRRRRTAEEIRKQVPELLKRKGPLSVTELSVEMGYARRSRTLYDVVQELLKEGVVSYLYPDKPKSRNQKLVLSE